MKNVKHLIAVFALLALPLISKAQNILVTFVANTSPTITSGVLHPQFDAEQGNISVGQSVALNSGKAPFSTIRFYFINGASGTIGYSNYDMVGGVPLSTILAMPNNTPTVFNATHNSQFTVVKIPGYSTSGSSYDFGLNVSFYVP